MNLMKLLPLVKGENAINFAKNRELIAKNRRCNKCKSRMEIIKDSSIADGCRWRCKNNKCKNARAIRDGSFFSGSKLTLETIILIIYFWCTDFTIMQAVKELEVSQKTLIDWYRFCRDIVGFHYESEEVSNTKIGGVGQVVEIIAVII